MTYTTKIGDYLVIQITAMVGIEYIAEVTQSEPLQMKVEEKGPFAHLKAGDYIIQEQETIQLQKDCSEETNVYLETMYSKKRKVASGLKSLGVDDKLRYIFPPNVDTEIFEKIPEVELERITEYRFICAYCQTTNYPETDDDSHEDKMNFDKTVPCLFCGKDNKVKF